MSGTPKLRALTEGEWYDIVTGDPEQMALWVDDRLAEKDAEIERLQRSPFHEDEIGNPWITQGSHERLLAEARADERRRTAEEIRLGMDHFNPKTVGSYLDGYLDACRDVARICDEVGASHDGLGEVSPANEDHRIVYVEPGASAFIQAVCACGEHLTGSGTTSISTLLAAHIREASPASDAVRDLAAPSSGPGGSRPSPGAAPRVEAIAKVAWEHPGGREFRKHADPFETVSPDVQRMYRKEAGLILAAADAADRAADPPWIRVRADEALAERIENIIRGAMLPVAVEGFTAIETHGPGAARTVLAALREAGEH